METKQLQPHQTKVVTERDELQEKHAKLSTHLTHLKMNWLDRKRMLMTLSAVIFPGVGSAVRAVAHAEEIISEIDKRYPDPPESTDFTDLRSGRSSA